MAKAKQGAAAAAHPPLSGGLTGSVLTRYWFDQDAVRHWSDRGIVGAWVEVEVALAKAQADLGMIPKKAARDIAKAADIEKVDMERIARDIASTMHPFVPLLRQLEEQCGPEAGGWLHWGATTQNIFDTGTSLLISRARPMLLAGIDAAMERMATLAVDHKLTVQAGRTHGQHALPITFGFKVASWLSEVRRHRARIVAASKEAEVAAFGGGAGTYAAMGGDGRKVQAGVAKLLGLSSSDTANRSCGDRYASYINALALFAPTVERICEDVLFLQRDEIQEASEAFHYGKVGSSTMAQKRNPSFGMNLTGVARLLRHRAPLAMEAMIRKDEGDGAGSNVMDTVLPEASILAISLAKGLAKLMDGLEVFPEAMKRNLEASRGMIMSEAVMMKLGPKLGRGEAHHLLYDAAVEAVASGRHLREVLAGKAELKGVDIAALLDPAGYLGEIAKMVEDEARMSRRATQG
jgi:adenylosuccinate lyase